MFKQLKIIKIKLVAILTIALSITLPATAADEKKYIEENYIEGGFAYHDLTNGFGNWSDVFIRASWRQDKSNVWDAEISQQDHFNVNGTYYVAGVTHTFNDDWYGSLHVGSSDGAFFLPKIRIDAYINRKFLKDKNLVGTVGIGYDKAQQTNQDRRLYIGASYYFEEPLVIEGGIRFNRSSPGPENSTRYRVAATYGKSFERYIIAEIEWGNEAYQFVSAATSIVDFESTQVLLTWREWLDKDWGVSARAEYYDSDNYNRTGVELSVFKHF